MPLDRERHLEAALEWLDDPEITRRMEAGVFPVSRPAEEAYFAESAGSGREHVRFAVERREGGELVGFASLEEIDWVSRTARTGTVIGAKASWSEGLGTDTVETRTRYAFETLDLRLLTSTVTADNTASLRVLLKAGYREAGRIPRLWWRHGELVDGVILYRERGDLVDRPIY